MLFISAAAEKHLLTLQPSFRWRVWLWLVLVKLFLGLDVLITSSLRTPAQQNALHKANPNNPAYDPAKPSSHNLGRAVDVNFLKNGVVVLRMASSATAWLPVVQLARLCGLRWGGAFSNYYDPVHFDDY